MSSAIIFHCMSEKKKTLLFYGKRKINVLETKMPLESCNEFMKNTEATIKIPFDSLRHAEIAYRVLSVDQEPRRNFVTKDLQLVNDSIEVHFTADQVKNLRTAITSFFENLLLCKDTIKEFDFEA